MDDLEGLKRDFLTEAKEHLDSAEEDILQLENQGTNYDPEVLNRLFRAMHSIKGGSSFLNLNHIKELAHALENVISNLRNKILIPNKHITDLLLKGVDKLKLLVYDLDNEAGMDISRELSDIEQVLTSPIIDKKITDKKAVEKKKPDTINPEKSSMTVLQQKASETAVMEKETEPPLPHVQIEPGMFLYNFTLNLEDACDRKQVSLEQFLKNLNLVGNVIRLEYDRQSIGTLGQLPGSGLIVNMEIRSIIDDQDIFLETLDIKPIACTQTREKAKTVSVQQVQKTDGKKMGNNGSTVSPVVRKTVKTGEQVPVSQGEAPDKGKSASEKPVTVSPINVPQQAAQEKKSLLQSGQMFVKSSAPSTIRIPLTLLDKLMNYASELVLVRNQNMQAVEAGDIDHLRAIAKKLNVVTSGLQAGILQTRMQSVDAVFSKFTRIVRDLSHALEKEVTLEIEGQDVELDKNIIESLADPLTHLIRNAVDHGIEIPAEREAAGKSRAGKVLLGAYHKAGHVNIIIQDDGKGMNPAGLIAAAVRKGVLSPEKGERIDEEDAYNLIFKPGFSTAAEVTELSGRGVGMDVVKTNLEKIGGVINIRSQQGKGTTFDIRLPLTLSIMQALIVLVEDICFAIPQFNIAEIVRLYGEDIYRNIRKVYEQEIFSLRGKLIPVIRLAGVLKIPRTYTDPATCEKREDRRTRESSAEQETDPRQRRNSPENSVFILILNLGNIQYGLIIDTILDTEEIVIKPLHDQVKQCRAYAGTTVLGDGRIAMILDIAGIAELAKFNINRIEKLNKKEKKVIDDRQTVITFDIGSKETYAVHLFLISHIEKIRRSEILIANNKEYFRFQENIIRLIRIEAALDAVEAHYTDEVFIIIIKGKQPVGLLVARILDTTMINTSLDFADTTRPGMIGVLMINNHLTIILDVFSIINRIEPGWFSTTINQQGVPRKVLLLEDTKFYASLITSYLSGTGIEVLHAHNGKEGIELLEEHTFDIIISDLSMPLMDGFEFARYVRAADKYKDTRLIAISAAYDAAGGKILAMEAGFDEYVSKLDREGMLDSFKQITKSGGGH